MSENCDICGLAFQDKYAYEGHLTDKKHQKNVQRQLQIQKEIDNSIFVLLPNKVPSSEIVKFFSKFGIIEKYCFWPSYAIFEFTQREPVEFLLNKPVWLNNHKLHIKRRIQKRQWNPYNNKNDRKEQKGADTDRESVINIDKVLPVLKDLHTFEEQLQALQLKVQLDDKEIEDRYEATCTHLDSLFKAIFPRCSVHRFGSTLAGLGLKECDLDVYLSIGEPIYEDSALRSFNWTPQKIFREVKRMMYKMNTIFSHLVPIPKARMPIIKFLHIPTQVFCDISFKNDLAVHNSRLIKFYLSLDVRLKPLLIFLKCWAKYLNISGSGKITNYALTMLTFFYLQQPSVKLIPTVLELQKSCEPHVVDGWQVNINENAVLPAVTNDSSVLQLLHGFFTFYANFEFSKKIICPFDGMAWSRDDFKRYEDLPDYFNRYKAFVNGEENTFKPDYGRPMCVQDPLELSQNIMAAAGQHIVDTFKYLCVRGADICSNDAKENQKGLMQTLFLTLPKERNKVEWKLSLAAGKFANVGLPANFETRTDIADKQKFIRDNWHFTVFNMVKDTFEKIFKLKVEIHYLDVEAKQQKIEVISDVHSKDHQTILLHCTGSQCLWRDRKKFQTILDPTLSCLEKEALVSERVIQWRQSEGNGCAANLDFTCKFEKMQEPLCVILSLTNENSTRSMFYEFRNHLQHTLPTIIQKTFMHMQQYNKH